MLLKNPVVAPASVQIPPLARLSLSTSPCLTVGLAGSQAQPAPGLTLLGKLNTALGFPAGPEDPEKLCAFLAVSGDTTSSAGWIRRIYPHEESLVALFTFYSGDIYFHIEPGKTELGLSLAPGLFHLTPSAAPAVEAFLLELTTLPPDKAHVWSPPFILTLYGQWYDIGMELCARLGDTMGLIKLDPHPYPRATCADMQAWAKEQPISAGNNWKRTVDFTPGDDTVEIMFGSLDPGGPSLFFRLGAEHLTVVLPLQPGMFVDEPVAQAMARFIGTVLKAPPLPPPPSPGFPPF